MKLPKGTRWPLVMGLAHNGSGGRYGSVPVRERIDTLTEAEYERMKSAYRRDGYKVQAEMKGYCYMVKRRFFGLDGEYVLLRHPVPK